MANRILFLETPDIPKTPVGEEPTAKTSDLINDNGFVNAAQAAAAAPVQSVNGQTGAVTVKTPYYLTVTDSNGTITVDKTPAEIDALSADGYDVHMRLTLTLGQLTLVADLRYFGTLGESVFYGMAQRNGVPIETAAIVNTHKSVDYDLIALATEDDIMRIDGALSDKADRSEIPSLSGYATETWVQNRGYQTAAQVQNAIAAAAELPTVTASDNGKFLRVVNGAWAAETVQTWQGGSY